MQELALRNNSKAEHGIFEEFHPRSREELLKRGKRDYRERDFPCPRLHPRLHPRFVVHAHFTVSEVVARDVLYEDITELAIARLFSRARAM